MIGERLKEERNRLSITQNDLANLVGVTRSAVVDWEKNKSSPNAVQLSKMDTSNLDIMYLITGKRFNVFRPKQSTENKNVTSFGDRLRVIRESLSLNQSEFGVMANVSRGSQAHYERDERTPLTSYIIKLKELGIDIDYLMTGEMVTPAKENNEIQIPYFTDVAASAGTGLYPLDETINESISISRDIFFKELKYNPKNLSVIKVKGDSMIGVLNDGDRIIIDHDSTEIHEGIFVIRIDGELLVKRIQRLPGRIINVISSNPDYGPIPISLDSPPQDFAVVGKVIMVCKFV